MDQISQPESISSLEKVREQFEAWCQRLKKRSAIPDALWQAAINLCQDYSISKISSMLRLNYAVLKQRVRVYGINHPGAYYRPQLYRVGCEPVKVDIRMHSRDGGSKRRNNADVF